MRILVISGSNNIASGSRKTANYIIDLLQEQKTDVALWDLAEMNLPMWSSEHNQHRTSDFAAQWKHHKELLHEVGGMVLVVPEWHGTVPPSVQNLLMFLDREDVAHKPVLLVGVSAGIGGAYLIAQIKSSANKNNRMLVIPDHVIVRHVNDDFDAGDHPIGPRLAASTEQLLLYAKHMTNLRSEMTFDYDQFAHGM